MSSWEPIAARALVSGTLGSLASAAALACLAKAEGKSPVQPVNATSHWLHGEQAASVREADLAHTALGYATHHASALFWALPFELWLAARPARTPLETFRNALGMSAIAAAVDYGITPKRLTPGWEHVLSKRSMAIAYIAMALGLGFGALVSQELFREPQSR